MRQLLQRALKQMVQRLEHWPGLRLRLAQIMARFPRLRTLIIRIINGTGRRVRLAPGLVSTQHTAEVNQLLQEIDQRAQQLPGRGQK